MHVRTQRRLRGWGKTLITAAGPRHYAAVLDLSSLCKVVIELGMEEMEIQVPGSSLRGGWRINWAYRASPAIA
jgi:hypothetical protein